MIIPVWKLTKLPIESLVTGGIPYFILVCLIFLFPCIYFFFQVLSGKHVPTLEFGLCIFFVILISKSGTINSGYFVVLFLPHFINLRILAFQDLRRYRFKRRSRFA